MVPGNRTIILEGLFMNQFPNLPIGHYRICVYRSSLDLGLELLAVSLELLHISRLCRPFDAEALGLVGLRDHMEVNMVNFLMSNAAIVLEDIVIGGTSRVDNLLDNRQNLGEVIVRNIGQLSTVVLGNDKSVALAERTNIKESESLVALK